MAEGRKLTKAEIIEIIHPGVDVSKKSIHRVLGLFFDAVKDGLLDEHTIELRGFGTFEIRTRKGQGAQSQDRRSGGSRRPWGGYLPSGQGAEAARVAVAPLIRPAAPVPA